MRDKDIMKNIKEREIIKKKKEEEDLKKSIREKLREEYESMRKKGVFSRFLWRPREPGIYRIRILPALLESDNGLFYKKVASHWGVIERPIPCKEIMYNEPCPICEEVKHLYEEGSESAIKRARRIRRTVRYLVRILDYENLEGGIKIFPVPSSLFEEILGFILDEEAGFDITDLKEGAIIKLERVEKEGRVSYSFRPLKPSPIDVDIYKMEIPSFEEVTDFVIGTPRPISEEEEEEVIEEEIPKPPKRSESSIKRILEEFEEEM